MLPHVAKPMTQLTCVKVHLSHQISNSDSIVQELQTIFADRAIEDLQLAAAQSSDIHGAVDIALDQQMTLAPMASDPTYFKFSTEHKNKGHYTAANIAHI